MNFSQDNSFYWCGLSKQVSRQTKRTTFPFDFFSFIVLAQRLLLAGAILLGLVLSAPAQAQNVVVSPSSPLELDEGGAFNADKTYKILKVKLSRKPASSRTVTLTADPDATNSDIKLMKDDATSTETPSKTLTLTFNTSGKSKWSKYQKIRVIAESDDDANNDDAVIKITGTGITEKSVSIYVQDDDETKKLNPPNTPISVTEGKDKTFEVSLKQEPAFEREIKFKVSNQSNARIEVSVEDPIFRKGSWKNGKTVKLKALQDDDAADGSATIIPRFRQIVGSGYQWKDSPGDAIQVTVTDDDSDMIISPLKLKIDEGSYKTFTIRLAKEPENNQVVTLASNDSDVTVDADITTQGSQNTLTFTNSNTSSDTGSKWNQAQTVRVTAANDADKINGTATITVTSPGLSTQWIPVTVIDDDVEAGLILNPTSLTAAEGSSGAFSVALAKRPGESVTVTLAQPANTDVTIADTDAATTGSQNTLTFTTSNWSTAQTVTVNAEEDADAITDSATINLSASGGDYGSVTNSLVVTVTDNDTAALTIEVASPFKADEGGSNTFKVKLATQPASNVTVTLGQPDNTDVTVADTDSDTAGNQNTLIFTNSNWNQAQTVTVNAAEDADAIKDTARINLSASGADYGSATGEVVVEVKENDTAALTIEAANPFKVPESGSGIFKVKLATQPSANVTVTLTQPSNTEITVDTDTDMIGNQTTLSFTTSNWNMAQNVTVSASHDQDAADDSSTITLSASGGDYASKTGSVAVAVADDDAEFVLSKSSLEINEGGSGTFTVKLKWRPSSSVTVTLKPQPSNAPVSIDADDRVFGEENTLTFTASNWNTARTVSVRATEDDDALDNDITINLKASDAESSKTIAGSVAVTVDDKDTAGLMVSKTILNVDEGANNTFWVNLATRPSGDVKVSITQTGTTNSDVTATASLTFTTGNWNALQTVTVNAIEDDDGIDDSAMLQVSASGGSYDDVASKNVSVEVTDNDRSLTVSTTDLTVTEGSSNSFTVKLATRPSGNVTVSIAQPSTLTNSDVTATASLTFTKSNWDTAKTVTVNAAEDDDGIDDSATLQVSATGGSYDDVDSKDVSVKVTDNDRSLTVSTTNLTVVEGASNSFTVKLATQPSGNVTVSITQTGTLTNSDVTATASLTFTKSNWDRAQTVTVNAAKDDDGIDDRATLQVSATGGSYGDVDSKDVSVKVTDNDRRLTVSTTNLTVVEGASNTFTVRLATQPSGNVTVSIAQPGPTTNSDVTATASLTFTTSNWGTAQTVTVNAADDPDAFDGSATLRVSASGGGYDDAADVNVSVAVDDNDTAALAIVQGSDPLALDEGGSGTFTVALATQPSANVTVTLGQATDTDVTFDANTKKSGIQTQLTFTTSNWNTPQNIKVMAAHDNDSADDSAIINLVAADGGYGSVSGSVSVRVRDDDDPALTLSTSSLTINEGGSGTFTVRLATQPSKDVTVTLEQPSNTDVTVDTNTTMSGNQNTLSFTTSNWAGAQTVTVRAAEDDHAAQDTATINLTAKGGDYGSVSDSVSVKVIDNDAVALTLSSNSLKVKEGTSNNTFTVRLPHYPGIDRRVNLTSDKPDVTVSPTALNFTAGNWSTPQTVRVTVAQDEDKIDDSADIDLKGTGVTTSEVEVLVFDDEIQLQLSKSSLNLTEGTTQTFTASLSALPQHKRAITVTSSNSRIVVTPTQLEFPPNNWNTAQTLTVTAFQDNIRENKSATINLTGNPSPSGSVYVSFLNDDGNELEFVLSASSLKLTEQGRQETFKVRLNAPPGSNRLVSLTSTNSDVRFVGATSLAFTNANWQDDQTVTVKAIGDSSTYDEYGTIKLTGGGIPMGRVTVTVIDDDSNSLNLILSAGMMTVTEGSSGTFTVKLNAPPGYNNNLAVILKDNSNFILATPAPTFTNQNWDIPRTVRVYAYHDGLARADYMATVDLEGSRIATKWVKVTVQNDYSVDYDDIDILGPGPHFSPTQPVEPKPSIHVQ